jgi:hypothetical protein
MIRSAKDSRLIVQLHAYNRNKRTADPRWGWLPKQYRRVSPQGKAISGGAKSWFRWRHECSASKTKWSRAGWNNVTRQGWSGAPQQLTTRLFVSGTSDIDSLRTLSLTAKGQSQHFVMREVGSRPDVRQLLTVHRALDSSCFAFQRGRVALLGA